MTRMLGLSCKAALYSRLQRRPRRVGRRREGAHDENRDAGRDARVRRDGIRADVPLGRQGRPRALHGDAAAARREGAHAAPPAAPAPAAAPDDAAKDAGAKDARKGPLTPAEQEQEYRKRQLEAQKARGKEALAAKDAEAKQENCVRAREALRTFESGQRVSRTNAQGERYYLDDDARASETEAARRAVQDWCG